MILTRGERETHAGGLWHVPKLDLMLGLRVMLEQRELELSRRVAGVELLAREMAGVEQKVSGRGRESFGAKGGGKDDLVMACALACWRARWKGGDWGE